MAATKYKSHDHNDYPLLYNRQSSKLRQPDKHARSNTSLNRAHVITITYLSYLQLQLMFKVFQNVLCLTWKSFNINIAFFSSHTLSFLGNMSNYAPDHNTLLR